MNLSELKAHFDRCEYPQEFQLDECTYLKNSHIFVRSHIEYLESNPKNSLFIPYYNRLLLFYQKTTTWQKETLTK